MRKPRGNRVTIDLDVTFEVEYEFGDDWRGRIWGWLFQLAADRCERQTLVSLEPVRGGAVEVVDRLAVESLLAEVRREQS